MKLLYSAFLALIIALGLLAGNQVFGASVFQIVQGGTNASSFTTSGNGVYYNGTSLLTAPTNSAVTYPYASSSAVTAGNLTATNITVNLAANTIARLNDNSNASGIWGTSIGFLSQSGLAQITTNGGALTFNIAGTRNTMTAGTEYARLTVGGAFDVGTTSNYLGQLNVASTSASQFCVLSGSSTNPFCIRTMADSSFWLGTSTQSGATSTTADISIDTNGVVTVNSLKATNLTSGNCVQASTGGLLIPATNPCGTGAALSVSGSITGTSYNGSAAVSDWTLNMANGNTWTALQTFKYASSTGESTSYSSSSLGWFQKVGVSSSTGMNAVSIGATTTYASIAVAENVVATSTAMTIDWTKSNQQNIQIGASATAVGFDKASTTGQTLRLLVCNGAVTAGALTFASPILWSGGTAPTQTTTANKCDVWSFIVTQGTSTNAAPSPRILGAQTPNF